MLPFATLQILVISQAIPSTNGQWTTAYGDTRDTTQYLLEQNDPLYITKICVYSNQYVNAIQVTWNDDTTSNWVGSLSGSQNCYTVNDDECFNRVSIRSDSWIYALRFWTTDGQSTSWWGGNGGSRGDEYADTNQCLSDMDVYIDEYNEVGAIRFQFITTPEPTAAPTNNPSSVPTLSPISTPAPSAYPTNDPTGYPSDNPTSFPSKYPSVSPSTNPSTAPSDHPSTIDPTLFPTSNPTIFASNSPSDDPSQSRTYVPSSNPSMLPSNFPSTIPFTSDASSTTEIPIISGTVGISSPSEVLTTTEDVQISTTTLVDENTPIIPNTPSNKATTSTDDSIILMWFILGGLAFMILGTFMLMICCIISSKRERKKKIKQSFGMKSIASSSEVSGDKLDLAHVTGLKNIQLQKVDFDYVSTLPTLPTSPTSPSSHHVIHVGLYLANDNTGTGSRHSDKLKDQDISSRISSNPQISGVLSPSPPVDKLDDQEFIIKDDEDDQETPDGNTDDTGPSGKITGSEDANNESDAKYQDLANDDHVSHNQEVAFRVNDEFNHNHERKVDLGSMLDKPLHGIANIPVQNYDHKTETEMMRQWLEITVRLPQYYDMLMDSGYESLDIIKEIEDRAELKAIGIILRGHQTKFLAAIKRLRKEFNGVREIAPRFIPYGQVSSFSPVMSGLSDPSLQYGDVQRNHNYNPDYDNVEEFKNSMEEVMHKKPRLYSDDQYMYEGDESDPSIENLNDELDALPETPDMYSDTDVGLNRN